MFCTNKWIYDKRRRRRRITERLAHFIWWHLKIAKVRQLPSPLLLNDSPAASLRTLLLSSLITVDQCFRWVMDGQTDRQLVSEEKRLRVECKCRVIRVGVRERKMTWREGGQVHVWQCCLSVGHKLTKCSFAKMEIIISLSSDVN